MRAWPEWLTAQAREFEMLITQYTNASKQLRSAHITPDITQVEVAKSLFRNAHRPDIFMT